MPETYKHAASFRDPSGYIFVEDGILLRQINPVYFATYRALTDSGFYKKLISNRLLIPHEEVRTSGDSVVIKPERIPFFSYPYEWSFNQYKHAALHTLKLQKYCLQNGWSLKDATAFNITFHKGSPVFADTLSFDPYIENTPWRAYQQFLTHFLAPLVLAKYYGSDMLKSLQLSIDGIALQKTAKLLPFTARFNPVLYSNIFLAAKYDRKFNQSNDTNGKMATLSKQAQFRLLDSLYNYIKDLELNEKTEWKDYYDVANYDAAAFEYKKQLVKNWLSSVQANKFIDLGGNDGTFSRMFKDSAEEILVVDIDPNAVDYNYRQVLKNKEENILPLVGDVLNPAPGIGFGNAERTSLLQRITQNDFDATLALALIHHISLSGNVPFEMSAEMFASFSPYLIIEFPDRDDSWADFLLKSKREFMGHFDGYNLNHFEDVYSEFFDIKEKVLIPGTKRTMYLLKRK